MVLIRSLSTFSSDQNLAGMFLTTYHLLSAMYTGSCWPSGFTGSSVAKCHVIIIWSGGFRAVKPTASNHFVILITEQAQSFMCCETACWVSNDINNKLHSEIVKIYVGIVAVKVLLWCLQAMKFQVAKMTIYPLSFNKTNCNHLICKLRDTNKVLYKKIYKTKNI